MTEEPPGALPPVNPEDDLEKAACVPRPVDVGGFNGNAQLPYGLTTQHLYQSMSEFVSFLGFINQQLNTRGLPRLESLLMQANFSSMVGEFMSATIPKYCHSLAKNRYHNGHPDLVPAGMFPGDAVRHSSEGIEIKGSRHLSGWQGHNRENVWLMVFVFSSNTQVDAYKGVAPKEFSFVKVVGAKIVLEDWKFSGRSETSRRTITASVSKSGYQKMQANWIYQQLTPESTLSRPEE